MEEPSSRRLTLRALVIFVFSANAISFALWWISHWYNGVAAHLIRLSGLGVFLFAAVFLAINTRSKSGPSRPDEPDASGAKRPLFIFDFRNIVIFSSSIIALGFWAVSHWYRDDVSALLIVLAGASVLITGVLVTLIYNRITTGAFLLPDESKK